MVSITDMWTVVGESCPDVAGVLCVTAVAIVRESCSGGCWCGVEEWLLVWGGYGWCGVETVDVVAVLVVELPQTPDDDSQKSQSCAWKVDELITVGAWVYLVMAMVGWVGVGMEVVVGKHAGQSH